MGTVEGYFYQFVSLLQSGSFQKAMQYFAMLSKEQIDAVDQYYGGTWLHHLVSGMHDHLKAALGQPNGKKFFQVYDHFRSIIIEAGVDKNTQDKAGFTENELFCTSTVVYEYGLGSPCPAPDRHQRRTTIVKTLCQSIPENFSITQSASNAPSTTCLHYLQNLAELPSLLEKNAAAEKIGVLFEVPNIFKKGWNEIHTVPLYIERHKGVLYYFILDSAVHPYIPLPIPKNHTQHRIYFSPFVLQFGTEGCFASGLSMLLHCLLAPPALSLIDFVENHPDTHRSADMSPRFCTENVRFSTFSTNIEQYFQQIDDVARARQTKMDMWLKREEQEPLPQPRSVYLMVQPFPVLILHTETYATMRYFYAQPQYQYFFERIKTDFSDRISYRYFNAIQHPIRHLLTHQNFFSRVLNVNCCQKPDFNLMQYHDFPKIYDPSFKTAWLKYFQEVVFPRITKDHATLSNALCVEPEILPENKNMWHPKSL